MVQRKYLTLSIGIVVIISALGAAFLLLPPSKGDMDITIAYSEKVNYETLIVANEEGMFADHGLNVSTKLVTGGILAAEALITGSADLAAMGDAPAVQVITKDTGAKIVARFIGASGMHRIIACNFIVEPKDLEGKEVGLQETSSSHGAFMQ